MPLTPTSSSLLLGRRPGRRRADRISTALRCDPVHEFAEQARLHAGVFPEAQKLDATGTDVFVHAQALERSGIVGLQDGQRVRLTTRHGVKGPQADYIKL